MPGLRGNSIEVDVSGFAAFLEEDRFAQMANELWDRGYSLSTFDHEATLAIKKPSDLVFIKKLRRAFEALIDDELAY